MLVLICPGAIWTAQANVSLGTPNPITSMNQKEITLFKDTEEREQVGKQHIDIFRGSNPYPIQIPNHILGRKYRVGNFTWQISLGFSQTLLFPAALLSIPTLQHYLLPFKYLRAGVEIDIRINTSSFHYGALMASWLPNHTSNAHCDNLRRKSGNHPITISASLQQACTLHIPWINNYNYCDVATATSEIGVLFLDEIVPLNRISEEVTDTVEVQIYAAFTNLDVAAYLPINTFMEAQSDPKAAPAKKMPAPYKLITPPGPAVEDKKEDLPENQPPPKEYFVPGIDDGPEQYESNQVATSGADSESNTKSIAKDTALPFFGALGDIFGGVVSLGKGVAKMFTIFDKPTTNQPQTPIYDAPFFDISHSSGIDISPKLALYKGAITSNCSIAMGNPAQEVTLASVACVPMIETIINFNELTDTYAVALKPLHLVNGSLDYFGSVANLFDYWRGSIKYMLQFFTSPFVTCRFAVHVLYSATIPSDSNSGDTLTQILDVKGDTTYTLSIPFLWHTMWRFTNDATAYPQLIIKPLIVPVGPSFSADPNIGLVLWRAAGEDIQFMRPIAPVMQAQCDVRVAFAKKFPPIISGAKLNTESGYCSPESVLTFNALWKRFQQTGTTSGSNVPTWAFTRHIDYTATFFKYWHGSRRCFTTLRYDGVSLAGPLNANTFSLSNGAVLFSNGAWNVQNASSPQPYDCFSQEFTRYEVPWYNRVPFSPIALSTVPVSENQSPCHPVASKSYTTQRNCWAGGEDFSLGFLVAPLPLPIPAPLSAVLADKAPDLNADKPIRKITL